MTRALELARRGGRAVRPNPMVGCVIVSSSGQVLGEGWHAEFGGPHAEVVALRQVREKHGRVSLADATAYVNLEPCSHHGKTPPCTDLLIREGVGAVVFGAEDPNPEVTGAKKLRDEGIEVRQALEAEARELNAGFLTWMAKGRPRVTLKIAQSLDGFVAPAKGPSRWITGEASRVRVHKMRAHTDAILTGSGTVLTDDPALTVRHVEGPDPRRIVLDRRGVVSQTARVRPALIVSGPEGSGDIRVPETAGGLDLEATLKALAARDVQNLMVEAGPTLSSAFLAARLVDELAVFVAPLLLGGGKPAFRDPMRETLADALRAKTAAVERIGEDILIRLTL